MEVQRAALVPVDLVGGRGGGLLRHPHVDQHADQLGPLGLRMLAEGAPLHAHLGLDLLVGGRDRGVLAQRHRERAGQQAGDAGQQHCVRAGAGATPAISAVLLTSPSIAPNVAARNQPPRHVGVPMVDLMRQPAAVSASCPDSVMS